MANEDFAAVAAPTRGRQTRQTIIRLLSGMGSQKEVTQYL